MVTSENGRDRACWERDPPSDGHRAHATAPREVRAPTSDPRGLSRTEAIEDGEFLMWSAIVALHGPYPRALAFLKEGWWEDAAI